MLYIVKFRYPDSNIWRYLAFENNCWWLSSSRSEAIRLPYESIQEGIQNVLKIGYYQVYQIRAVLKV